MYINQIYSIFYYLNHIKQTKTEDFIKQALIQHKRQTIKQSNLKICCETFLQKNTIKCRI